MQLPWLITLSDIAGRSGLDAAGRQLYIIVQAQNQNLDSRMDSFDAPSGLRTAQIRSNQIHQHHIRPQTCRLGNCSSARVSLTDNLDKRSFPEQTLNTLPEQRIFIADENPDLPRRASHVVSHLSCFLLYTDRVLLLHVNRIERLKVKRRTALIGDHLFDINLDSLRSGWSIS